MATLRRLLKAWASLLLCGIVAAWLGCKADTGSTAEKAAPEVEVATVLQQDVPIYSEWVGTTEGLVNATIRAQVTGYLISRNYEEGAPVKKHDVLFQIDPRKFQAALDQASGDLERARAELTKNELDVNRNRPLAKEGAISQKELEDSIQALAASKASVASAKAAVEQAKLNLEWTTIRAPIDGVVGIAKAQVGDLVNPNDELTSMSTLDPIRVYFPVSEQQYLRAAEKVRAAYDNRGQGHEAPHLDMVMSDGRTYPHKGWYYLADRQVDVKTGTIMIAALFPNPGNLLRPGLFARVRAITRTRQGALLIPQRAVSELQGSHQVAVVGPENKVEIRPVKVGERLGTLWVIAQGLKPGERVVVEGLQKLEAGMTVLPKPFDTEQAAERT